MDMPDIPDFLLVENRPLRTPMKRTRSLVRRASGPIWPAREIAAVLRAKRKARKAKEKAREAARRAAER